MTSIRDSINAAVELIEDRAESEAPAPLAHGEDDSSPVEHARREKAAEEKGRDKRTIRDSLKDASALTAERRKERAIAEAVNKPIDSLTAKQRADLAEFFRKGKDGESEEQAAARKGFLKELRKLEPEKKDRKPETVREGMDARREALRKAMDAHKGSLDPRSLHTPEQRQIRSEIKARWPGKKLPEVLGFFREWHDKILADPLTAWQAIAEHYAANHDPRNDAKSKHTDDGKKDLGSTLKRASGDASDLGELADAIKEYGADFPELLRRANEWDKSLRSDPFGAAARLASTLGALEPPSPQQQEERRDRELAASIAANPATTPEGVARQIVQGFTLIAKHKVLPGLDDPEMQEEMAGILSAPGFPVHLGWGSKLKLAWQVANDRRKHRKKKASSTDNGGVEPGSKSISGAPAPGGGGAKPSKSGIRGSLERAAGGI